MEIATLHLDEIVKWIDRVFGEAIPTPRHVDAETLRSIFGDRDYQRYLQDQINRRIIRDYLTNAVVLGVMNEGGLAAFAAEAASEEGRAALALDMLMSSVEEAKDLPSVHGDREPLKQLKGVPGNHSHIKLVPN